MEQSRQRQQSFAAAFEEGPAAATSPPPPPCGRSSAVEGKRVNASQRSLCGLPDELCLRVLYYLDVNDLLAASRTSRHLRVLSLDPLLHKWRLAGAHDRVSYLLPRRPLLHMLQPPISTIYLTRTHLAARRLHWSLVCIRLNRSLLRRPKMSTLVSANILPRECCRKDRTSGEYVWGVAGTLFERKRKVEVEKIKEGLRVWLERKAREIRSRRDEGGVGALVWRFSRKTMREDTMQDSSDYLADHKKERVNSLRRFFEGLGNGRMAI